MADDTFETISQKVGEEATRLVGGDVEAPQKVDTREVKPLSELPFFQQTTQSPFATRTAIITGDEARTQAQEDLTELAEIQVSREQPVIVPPTETRPEIPGKIPKRDIDLPPKIDKPVVPRERELAEVEGEVISEREQIIEETSKTLGRQVLPGEQIVRTIQETGLSLEEQLDRARAIFQEEGLTRDLSPGEISDIERGNFSEDTLRLRAKRELGLPTAALQAQILGTEELTAANTQIDEETDDALSIIDQTRTFIQTSALRIIEGIQTSYNKRRRQMQRINDATLARQTIAGIRAGRQRFAPEIQTSILSAEEKDGIERLADLDAEEASLIMQAQDAATLKDFALLSQRLEVVREARKEKTDLLIELQKLAIEQEKALREKLKFEFEMQKFPLELQKEAREARKAEAEIAELLAPLALINLTEDPEENSRIIQEIADAEGIDPNFLMAEVTKLSEAKGKPVLKTVGRSLVAVDPITGETREIFRAPSDVGALTLQQMFSNTLALRKEFNAQSKDFITVRNSFARIQAAVEASETGKAGPGDLAMIFSFMKVLDPNSVVRESEFATAQDAAAFMERVYAKQARFTTGGRLSDETRRDFFDTAKGLFQAQLNQQDVLQQEFRDTATSFGINPIQVAPDLSSALVFGDESTIQEGLTEKIEAAERNDFSPIEILNFLSESSAELADKIRQAKDEDWGDEQIINFLKK